MTNWWETDTSATLRITCKVCGVVHDVTVSLSETDGQKMIEVEGYCDKHGRDSGIGEGAD